MNAVSSDREEVAQDFIKVFLKHGISISLDEALHLADVGIEAFKKGEADEI